MWTKVLMPVAWPAFMAACVLEAIVFAAVDPLELTWFQDPGAWSRQTVYTLAFFLFWFVAILSSALSLMLLQPSEPQTHPQL